MCSARAAGVFACAAASRRQATITDATSQIETQQLAGKTRQHAAFVRARLLLVLLFISLWLFLFPVGYPMPYGFLVALLAEAGALAVFLYGMQFIRRGTTLDRLHIVLLVLELMSHS